MKSLIDRIPAALKAKAKAAFVRASWTFGGALVSALGVGAATELDYVVALNFALGAAIVSFGKSMLVGMPETTYATVEPFTADVTGEQMLRVITHDEELHIQVEVPTTATIPDNTPTEPVAIATAAARPGKFKPRTQ